MKTKALCLEKGYNKKNMPRGLHLAFLLSIMPFANLSPKPETSSPRSTPVVTEEWQHGLLITPGCMCSPTLVPGGDPSSREPRRNPANLPPSAGTTRDGTRAVSWCLPERNPCWAAPLTLFPLLCFPKGLQVQHSAHKPRTSSCCRQALLVPPGLLSYSPWLICFSLFAASLQKCLLDISVWSTAVCLSSYFLLKMPDWLPEITKYCSHLWRLRLLKQRLELLLKTV